ncbi:P-loop NTPase fold protein [Actinokineospora diospyrosa]|uniref:KAP family P-loop domain-containing protein n=1 Tax=Actinokineospora diospyrosa TaxID=103728 RepID=A0ABT1IP03_9PSEU|nr:P-loop NTPase fold protein [Actinokineospora diospyrosa]MCP2274402.1 KAP family P-loop domain-containing protein [Actinokineospora diospyrosa]
MTERTRSWLAAERPVDLGEDVLFRDRKEFWGKLEFLADHVAAAVQPDSAASGTVFGISAPWGSGKSSALRMLWDLIVRTVNQEVPDLRQSGRSHTSGGQSVLTTSTYYANVHEAGGQSARLSLAYEVMQGYPEEYRKSMLTGLGYDRSAVGISSGLHAEIFLREKLGEYAGSGPVIEQWILDTFLEHQRTLREDGTSTTRFAHVHVAFIDDLDRCSEAFTGELLAALNFWSNVRNLFFVVAADEEHLKRSARRITDVRESAEDALEKFVHFQTMIPPLISGPVDAAQYGLRLLPADEHLNPGLRHLRSLLSEVRAGEPFGLMAPALGARTPRKAKRVLNVLLRDFWLLKDLEGDSVKRIIARMVWQEDFDRHIDPVLVGAGIEDASSAHPRADWLRILIECASAAVGSGDDVETAIARFGELAALRGVTLDGCEPRLLLYLGASPQLEPPSPRTHVPGGLVAGLPGTERSEERLSVVREANKGVSDLLTRAQIASKTADIPLLRVSSLQLVRAFEAGLLGAGEAPGVGNIALRLEREDVDLAWALHQVAHTLDPQHTNIRLNLVDFLLDQKNPAVEDIVVEHLNWCELNAPEFEPLRRRVYRARLDHILGHEITDIDELIDVAVADTGSAGKRQLWVIINDRNLYDRYVPLMRPWFEQDYQSGDYSRACTVLANYATGMIGSSDSEWAAHGADALRFRIKHGFLTNLDRLGAIDITNLAIYLGNIKHFAAAAALYRIAYEYVPSAAEIRSSYARFLVNVQDDPQNARSVQQGQELAIPLPDHDALVAAFADLPERFSDREQWWLEYPPVSLVTPIPEVGP